MAAIFKSLVCSPTSSQATFLLVLVSLVVQPQLAQPQPQTCSVQLGNLNMCAPFVVPGAGNASTDCCNALQAVEHDCLCSTLRIAARLPSQCNVPPISCSDN